jgi:Flp pilus assembly protein TadD
MITVKTLTAAAVALAVLTPYSAFAADDLGARAIRNQDWAAAETQILEGLERHPGDVFRLLNLAAVYGQTDRRDEAAAIYRQILNSDEDRVAAMATSRQGEPVKEVAERGLTLLESSQ